MAANHPGLKSLLLCLILLPLVSTTATGSKNQCLNCHQNRLAGQQDFHSLSCTTCHAGNNQARDKTLAHEGLIAFPGNLSNADQTCGQCHPAHTRAVHQHLMSTARGMVETTRRILEAPDDGSDISGLGHSVSDSLLRKLCAGCHLGRERTTHEHSTLLRGGGCLACHLDEYPAKGHVKLTTDISDARCFGCHSRSGRISLNYAGLAEFDDIVSPFIQQKARLPDGRLVQIKSSDVHHQAGLSCVDCHTGQGLMGISSDGKKTSDGIDIQCMDCHISKTGKTQRHQTPLKHLKIGKNSTTLTLKKTGQTLQVPQYSLSSPHHGEEHARLSCDACHSQWAPQCFGCHTSYEASGQQFDYLEQQVTPGRWHEQRWMILSELPALGVDNDGEIRPFVPGMIFTLEHPDLDNPVQKRLFAPLAPHTLGQSRSCQSCHCNSRALGLGKGQLIQSDRGWAFTVDRSPLADGIAEDAWQKWDGLGQGASTQLGARPLNEIEITRILNAEVQCP